jgi:hypothetical protein
MDLNTFPWGVLSSEYSAVPYLPSPSPYTIRYHSDGLLEHFG